MTSNFTTSDSQPLLVTLEKPFIESGVQTLARNCPPRSRLMIRRLQVRPLVWRIRIFPEFPRVSFQTSNRKVVVSVPSQSHLDAFPIFPESASELIIGRSCAGSTPR